MAIHGFQTDGTNPSPLWFYGPNPFVSTSPEYLVNYNAVRTVTTTLDTTSTTVTFSKQLNPLVLTGDPSVQLVADLKAFILSGGVIPIVQIDALNWALPPLGAGGPSGSIQFN